MIEDKFKREILKQPSNCVAVYKLRHLIDAICFRTIDALLLLKKVVLRYPTFLLFSIVAIVKRRLGSSTKLKQSEVSFKMLVIRTAHAFQLDWNKME